MEVLVGFLLMVMYSIDIFRLNGKTMALLLISPRNKIANKKEIINLNNY